MLTMYRRIGNSTVVFKAKEMKKKMTVSDLFKNGLVDIKVMEKVNINVYSDLTSAIDPKRSFMR